jgi:hypothetical protein
VEVESVAKKLDGALALHGLWRLRVTQLLAQGKAPDFTASNWWSVYCSPLCHTCLSTYRGERRRDDLTYAAVDGHELHVGEGGDGVGELLLRCLKRHAESLSLVLVINDTKLLMP